MSRLIRRMKDLQSRKGKKGLTLLEVGIVLAVFALIIIGVLTAVAVVNASRRNSQAINDIGNIRSAIVKWSAGGPVWIAGLMRQQATTGGGVTTVTVDQALMGWNQFGGYLPGHLQNLGALTLTNLTLSGANPWQGSYEILINSAAPRNFGIRLTDVDPAEVGAVINQLQTVGSGDSSVTPLVADVTASTMVFTVLYKN